MLEDTPYQVSDTEERWQKERDAMKAKSLEYRKAAVEYAIEELKSKPQFAAVVLNPHLMDALFDEEQIERIEAYFADKSHVELVFSTYAKLSLHDGTYYLGTYSFDKKDGVSLLQRILDGEEHFEKLIK